MAKMKASIGLAVTPRYCGCPSVSITGQSCQHNYRQASQLFHLLHPYIGAEKLSNMVSDMWKLRYIGV